METFLVIDGNSLINRAFYGTQASFMKNAEGLYTGALFGFLNIYLKHKEALNPTYVAVAFDLKAPTFRHQAYAAYKGTRKSMPEELAMQMPVLKELLDAMGIPRLELPGYEADDLLGTCARMAEETREDVRTVILTGDRDSLQLISERTQVMLLTSKPGQNTGNLYDIPALMERYGVSPKAMIDVKALMGDTSDNIPGVPGVGEKTALSLITQYGSLDGVYEHIEEISKPALKAKLAEHKDSAYLSRMLGEICTQAPVELNWEIVRLKEACSLNLARLLDRLEFKTFKKKLCPNVQEVWTPVPAEEGGEDEPMSLFSFMEQGEATVQDVPEMDVETFLKGTGTVYGLVQTAEPMNFDLVRGEADARLRVTAEMAADVTKQLKALLEDDGVEKVFFQAKPFLRWCIAQGIEVRGVAGDLSVASYLLDSTRKIDDLGQVLRFLTGKSLLPNVFSIRDAWVAGKKRLEQEGQWDLYSRIELPLISVLANMESCGFKVDRAILEEEGRQLESRIQELTEQIYALAGEPFNINSTRQLGVILFEKLGLQGSKKTKTGYSTDADVLEKLAEEHEIIPAILEYRQNVKLKSTYIDGLLHVIDGASGRVHSTFHQTVTATGRLSSSEPNLQNIPIRSSLGRRIRKAFVPSSPEHVLIDADYSQIELRVLASMAGDEAMIQAFKEDADIHTITAAQVNGVPVEMVTPQMRAGAKAVNFGIVYGISEFGLSRDLGISRFEAKRYIESYFTQYPGIHAFMETMVNRAQETGYAETLLGRRRLLPELHAAKYMTRQFGERVAMNMPIQGTAADIIKLAMVRTEKALKDGGYKSKLILQVHDELLIDAVREEADAVQALLKESMEEAFQMAVPLKAEVSSSEVSWYYCK